MTSKSEGNEDLDLKCKVNAILRKQGCIVFNEVDLCTFSYHPKYGRKQITDLDALGICCDPDLYFRYTVAECKSVEEKAMEFLLKLHGTMSFFGAHKAYFVQKKIDNNAREVGKEIGAYCLDESNIDNLLNSMGVSDPNIQKMEHELYNTKRVLLTAATKKYKRPTNYFRYDFWTLPDHRNIINIIRLLNSCAKKSGEKMQKERIFIIYQLTFLLLISILRLCSAIIRMNYDDVVDGTKTSIMGGSRERRDREVLFDEVSRHIKEGPLQPYPPFLGSLTELINRYLSSLEFSADSIRCFEYIVNNYLNKCFQDIWGKVNDMFHEKTIKFARDVIYFVINITDLNKTDYSAILNDE